MKHIDVVRVVPVDVATGHELDDGFYAVLATGDDGVRVAHAAPTLARLREVAAEGGPAPIALPARPDPAADLARDVTTAVRAAWGRAQGTDATAPDVVADAVRAFLGSPSARRLLGEGDPEE